MVETAIQDTLEDGVPARTIRAATRLFAAQGFEGTALQEIAEAVGVRKASLLYHFPSKEELRRAVLDALLSRWQGVIPRLVLAAASRGDRLDAILRELIGFFAADPDRARLLLREALDRPAEMRRLLAERVAPWAGVVADEIRAGRERGSVHPDVDPEAFLLEIVTLVVAAVATGETIAVLAPPRGGRRGRGRPPLDRVIAEIRRIARTSLFRESRAAPRGAARAAPHEESP